MGKSYKLKTIENDEEWYMNMFKEFATDEEIKKYVADRYHYDKEAIEVVED